MDDWIIKTDSGSYKLILPSNRDNGNKYELLFTKDELDLLPTMSDFPLLDEYEYRDSAEKYADNLTAFIKTFVNENKIIRALYISCEKDWTTCEEVGKYECDLLYKSQFNKNKEQLNAAKENAANEKRKKIIEDAKEKFKAFAENPPTGSENVKVFSFPKNTRSGNDDYRQLFNNGCYYFKLSYAPNYQMNENYKFLFNDTLLTMLGAEAAKLGEKLNERIEDFKKDANANSEQKDITEKIWGAVKTGISDMGTNLLANAGEFLTTSMAKVYAVSNATRLFAQNTLAEASLGAEGLNAKINDRFVSLYNNQHLETAIIFLPLNAMTIKRQSGVHSVDNVMKSVIQNKLVGEMQSAEKSTSSSTTAKGYSDNKFKGIVTSGADFEKFSLEWQIMPKNRDEMEEILKILIYFQCACVSNIDLNDRSNKKWILPPVCELGIMVSDLIDYSKNKIKEWDFTKGYTFNDIRDNRNFSYYFDDEGEIIKGGEESYHYYDDKKGEDAQWKFDRDKDGTVNLNENKFQTKFSKEVNTLRNIKQKVKWLKKPVSIYIENVEITPLMNEGGVLLSQEGFPMGVKLRVDVMRTSLTTLDDMWNGDTKNRRAGYEEFANPFA